MSKYSQFPDAESSSPSRPPVADIWYYVDDEFFYVKCYGALYAAHYSLQLILEAYPDYKWVETNKLAITKDDTTLFIKSDHLEDIIEYEPTKAQAEYRPSSVDQRILKRILNFSTQLAPEEPREAYTGPASTPKPVKRTRTRKASTEGSVTVAELSDEYNISSGKARNLLRKAKFAKPPSGWTFTTDDPALDEVRQILSKG